MFFNSKRSLESICGVEISDDEYDTQEDDEKYFVVKEVLRATKTIAKKKKRSRFDIGTPTKMLQKENKNDKHPDPVKKKSPKIVLKKKGRPAKLKMIFSKESFHAQNVKESLQQRVISKCIWKSTQNDR